MVFKTEQIQSFLAVVFACKYADVENPMDLVDAAREVLGNIQPSQAIIDRAAELGIGGWIKQKEAVRT